MTRPSLVIRPAMTQALYQGRDDGRRAEGAGDATH